MIDGTTGAQVSAKRSGRGVPWSCVLGLPLVLLVGCAGGKSSALPGHPGSETPAHGPASLDGGAAPADDGAASASPSDPPAESFADPDAGASAAAACSDGGLDNTGCSCTADATRSCYGGGPSRAGVGVCNLGMQVCVATVGGEGTTYAWGPCTGWGPPTSLACDGKDDLCDGMINEGCQCTNGATQSCSSACGTGQQTCSGGAWGACGAPTPDPTGVCPCMDGATQACSSACGPGNETCSAGAWGACDAPQADAMGQCPCPAGEVRGTNGSCFTQAMCATMTGDVELNVDSGDEKSLTESCPPGLYAVHGHYSGTQMPCSWSSTDTSITLTCDNSQGGNTRNANHVVITCSCDQPSSSVTFDCSNCCTHDCN